MKIFHLCSHLRHPTNANVVGGMTVSVQRCNESISWEASASADPFCGHLAPSIGERLPSG